MKKLIVFIFLAVFFTVSVGFAETCEEYCRNRGGLGKCVGPFSGCPAGYKDSGGSYGCSWLFFPTKCCCYIIPTTTTTKPPTTTTTTTTKPTTPTTSTTLPCKYSITITPTNLISSDVRVNWKITLTDSSSSSCPSTTIFKIIPEISSGTICKYFDYPKEIPVMRGGSNHFYLTIEREYSLPCSLRLYIQDPNGKNIASAGPYTLSPILEVTTTTTLPIRECNVAKDCCNENRYGTYYKCYNGICVVAGIEDSDKYYCPIPGTTTTTSTTQPPTTTITTPLTTSTTKPPSTTTTTIRNYTNFTTTTTKPSCPYSCLDSQLCHLSGGVCNSNYYCSSGCCCSPALTTSTTKPPSTTTTKPPTTTTLKPTTTTTQPPTPTTTKPSCPYSCLDSRACHNLGGSCKSGYYCDLGCCCYIPSGPSIAGILGNLWDFIKSLLGIQ